MAKGDRIESLDMARGIAVILVVAMHASIIFPQPAALASFNSTLGAVRMPLLMLISGFLVAPALRTHRPLAPRIATLGWLFACWSLLTWVVLAMLKGAMPDPARYLEEFVAPTTPLWFVWALALMTAVVALTPERRRYMLIIIAGAASMALHADLFRVELFSFDHALQSGVFFFIGAIFPGHLQRAMRWSPLPCLAITLPLIGLGLGVDHILKSTLGVPLLSIPERLLACVAALQVCSVLSRAKVMAETLAWFGRNTLPVFVSHQLLIIAATGLFAFNALVPWVAIPMLTIGSVAASIGLRQALLGLNARWLYELPAPLCRIAEGAYPRFAGIGSSGIAVVQLSPRPSMVTARIETDRLPQRLAA